MAETVVHVTTLEQWKLVLDVWFEQGYKWNHVNGKNYMEAIFNKGSHYLILDGKYIRQSLNNFCERPFIKYLDFMTQQKERYKMKTYYVTQKQLHLIEELKYKKIWALNELINNSFSYKLLNNGLGLEEEKALLRYIGGDTSIEFKAKEQMYRLWGTDFEGKKAYFIGGIYNSATSFKEHAFTATLDEIKKWQTPDWSVEEVD